MRFINTITETPSGPVFRCGWFCECRVWWWMFWLRQWRWCCVGMYSMAAQLVRPLPLPRHAPHASLS